MEPLVALEEHFFADPTLIPSHMHDLYSEQFKHVPQLEDKLRSLSDLRLKDMAAAGVTYQIISHAPGISSLSASDCSKINDYLADRIKRYKSRYGGLAALPMSNPEAAAKELKRCVTDHGFLGALVDNHITTPLSQLSENNKEPSSSLGATYYDTPFFNPIWQAAQDLNVPIYIHPTFPTPLMQSHYDGLPAGASRSIATSGWGWHSEVGSHILRLFAAGTFDAFPKLKLIIGHFGEMLPGMLDRVNQLSYRWGPRDRNFQQVWDENIFITTSGVWSVSPMWTISKCTRMENVLFSIDWPFAKAEWGMKFWEELRESGIYGEEELRGIAWGNAVRLFPGLDEGLVLRVDEKEGK